LKQNSSSSTRTATITTTTIINQFLFKLARSTRIFLSTSICPTYGPPLVHHSTSRTFHHTHTHTHLWRFPDDINGTANEKKIPSLLLGIISSSPISHHHHHHQHQHLHPAIHPIAILFCNLPAPCLPLPPLVTTELPFFPVYNVFLATLVADG